MACCMCVGRGFSIHKEGHVRSTTHLRQETNCGCPSNDYLRNTRSFVNDRDGRSRCAEPELCRYPCEFVEHFTGHTGPNFRGWIGLLRISQSYTEITRT